MIGKKDRLVLRKFTKLPKENEMLNEVIEFKTLDEFVEVIKSSWNCEFYLYLGMYELGEIFGYKNDSISFVDMLGFGDYDDPVEISKEKLSKIINKEITIEEFLKTIFSDEEVELVRDSEKAWTLIQNFWIPTFMLKCAINPELAENDETIEKEDRIIFVKNI